MDKSKYIEKVKKLLALAKSTNPHEATLAMQRALKLMTEHSIGADDIELSHVNEFMSQGAPNDANKPPSYMGMLVSVVCRAFGCEEFRSYNRETCRRIITFYGMNERPQLAAYAFDVLTKLLIKARKEFSAKQGKRIKKSTKIARADLFCEGWVMGVHQIVDSFAMTEEEQILLTKYKEERLDLTTGTSREAKNCRGGDDTKWQGYRSGKQVQLNHAVNGASYSPLAIEG